MAETARCTKCELTHERTPDWHCPRCGSEVDLVDGGRLRSTEEFPAGSRLAGGLSLAAGLLALTALRGGAPLVTVAALITAAVGVALLARRRWARAIAFAFTVMGIVLVMVATMLSVGDGTVHFVAALTCGGFLVLLRGAPGKLAIAAGAALCAPGLVLGALAALNGRWVF